VDHGQSRVIWRSTWKGSASAPCTSFPILTSLDRILLITAASADPSGAQILRRLQSQSQVVTDVYVALRARGHESAPSLRSDRAHRTTMSGRSLAAQIGTYACGWRTGDHSEAHDRSVAVRPGALATGSVV
jgi:hypothetical protein